MRYAILAFPLLLCACATLEPKIVTKEVKIMVPVHCTPTLTKEPDYPATPAALKAAKDIFEQAKLIVAELILRRAREAELKAALDGCK